MSASDPFPPLGVQFEKGRVIGEGSHAAFHDLRVVTSAGPVVREDLGSARSLPHGRSVVRFVQLTDLQLADVRSPARIEYVNQHADKADVLPLLLGYRPYEFLAASVLVEMLRTINGLPMSADTGAVLSLAVLTGDMIDNGQANEFEWLIRLLEGGRDRFVSADGGPELVHSGWADSTAYWIPDGGRDDFKEFLGYPTIEGLVERAGEALESPGLKLDWILCNGNHEVLVQGDGRFSEQIGEVLEGSSKSVDLPVRTETPYVDRFRRAPEEFLGSAPQREIPPDSHRRPMTRREQLRRIFEAQGTPSGHGLSQSDVTMGRSYFCHDVGERVRFVVLDSAHEGGSALGAIARPQLEWMTERISEVCPPELRSESALAPTSRTVPAAGRYVIVVSHHPSTHFDNPLVRGSADYVQGHQLMEVLHSYGNVVCWLTGHTHRNLVVPHRAPSQGHWSFWEITTSSLMDWPCESRVLELIEVEDSLLIRADMVNFTGSTEARGTGWMASWHRVLASQHPWVGIGSGREGEPADRDVRLWLDRCIPGASITRRH
jgi:metallophosphoesterase (TIGR03767 family)